MPSKSLLSFGFSVWFSKLCFVLIVCSNAEGGLGLICTCIPAINKLFTEIRRKRREKREEKQRGNELSRPSPRPSDADSASLFLVTLPSIPSQES